MLTVVVSSLALPLSYFSSGWNSLPTYCLEVRLSSLTQAHQMDTDAGYDIGEKEPAYAADCN